MNRLYKLRIEAAEKKYGHPVHKYFESEYKVKKPKTAANLEALIEEYVNLIGGKISIISTTGRQMVKRHHVTDVLGHSNTITENKRIPSTTVKGTPDLLGCLPNGVALAVEVKFSKSDRMSKEQIEYKSKWKGVFIIAKTLEQFCDELEKYL